MHFGGRSFSSVLGSLRMRDGERGISWFILSVLRGRDLYIHAHLLEITTSMDGKGAVLGDNDACQGCRVSISMFRVTSIVRH